MNPDIDMSAIQEALKRRLQGGQSMPIGAQVSSPGGALPTGGMNTPTMPAPPMPEAPQSSIVPQAQGMAKSAQVAQGPAFDDQTKMLSKALVKKLLDTLA